MSKYQNHWRSIALTVSTSSLISYHISYLKSILCHVSCHVNNSMLILGYISILKFIPCHAGIHVNILRLILWHIDKLKFILCYDVSHISTLRLILIHVVCHVSSLSCIICQIRSTIIIIDYGQSKTHFWLSKPFDWPLNFLVAWKTYFLTTQS